MYKLDFSDEGKTSLASLDKTIGKRVLNKLKMGYLLDSSNHYILLYKNRKLAFKNLYVVSTGVKGIPH